jgi:hypothetical protein
MSRTEEKSKDQDKSDTNIAGSQNRQANRTGSNGDLGSGDRRTERDHIGLKESGVIIYF